MNGMNVWIPCNVSLPKYDGDYLTCNIEGEIAITTWYDGLDDDAYGWEDYGDGLESDGVIHFKGNVPAKYRIVAWMPLPEPYKVAEKIPYDWIQNYSQSLSAGSEGQFEILYMLQMWDKEQEEQNG